LEEEEVEVEVASKTRVGRGCRHPHPDREQRERQNGQKQALDFQIGTDLVNNGEDRHDGGEGGGEEGVSDVLPNDDLPGLGVIGVELLADGPGGQHPNIDLVEDVDCPCQHRHKEEEVAVAALNASQVHGVNAAECWSMQMTIKRRRKKRQEVRRCSKV